MRKLSAVEHLLWRMSWTTPFNFVLAARIRGCVSAEELAAALTALSHAYPMLMVRVEADSQEQPHFCAIDLPTLPFAVRVATGDDDWQREVEKQLLEPFDRQTGPLARFVLLQSADAADLLVVCDHLVADGMSAGWIIRDLCAQIAAPGTRKAAGPLPPSMASLIPAKAKQNRAVRLMIRVLPWVFKAVHLGQHAYRRLFPGETGAQPNSWQAAQDLGSQVPVQALAWSLTPLQTSQLLARCHAEGTTVHAALCVAFLRAWAAGCDGPPRRFRMVQTAVNVRARLSPPVGEECGLYAEIVRTRLNCQDKRDFWTSARSVRQLLDRATHAERLFGGAVLFEALTHGGQADGIRPFVDWMRKEKIPYDLSISNLGQLDIPEQYGRLRIESLHGPWVVGPHRTPFIGVVTLGDRMTFSLSIQDSSNGATAGMALKTAAMQQLAAAADWEPAPVPTSG